MSDLVFIVPALGIPALVSALEWTLLNDIVERHHSHHDTYRVSNTLTHTLVMIMVFMGFLGVVLGWLCNVGVFRANSHVLLAFFLSFLGVSLLIWTWLHRYKVVTYDDRMHITPPIGTRRTIRYDEIESMKWHRSKSLLGYENLRVRVKGSYRRVTLWGMLDLEQILMRINRYDAIDNEGVY